MTVFRNNNDEADDIITQSLRKPMRKFEAGGIGGLENVMNPPSPVTGTSSSGGGGGGSGSGGGGGTPSPTAPALPPYITSLYSSLKGDEKDAMYNLVKNWATASAAQKQSILGQLEDKGVNIGPIQQAENITPGPKDNIDSIEKLDKENVALAVPRVAGGAVIDAIKETDYYKDRMLNDGLAAEGELTGKFYDGVEGLADVGTPTLNDAVGKTGDTYDAYKDAASYDKQDYGTIANKYNKAGQYNKENYSGVGAGYKDAMGYDKTGYGDIEASYGKAGKYDTADFTTGSRKASEIAQYMDPYEKLVAERQRARMKEEFDQGQGERQSQAARAGAFGGSAAAVQEQLARKNYEDSLADWNAKSLSAAFQSGTGLQDKELSDVYREQAGEEASKQFGKQTELSALQGTQAARDAAAKETAAAKQAQLAGLEGLLETKTASAQETARAKEAELAGVAGLLQTGQASAQETARAKEAELAAAGGQLQSSQLLGSQGAAQKEMGLTDLGILQTGGQMQDQRAKDEQNFALDTTQKAMNIYGTGISGSPGTAPPPKPSMFSNILSGVTAGAGALETVGKLGLFREGGVVALHNALYRNRKNG